MVGTVDAGGEDGGELVRGAFGLSYCAGVVVGRVYGVRCERLYRKYAPRAAIITAATPPTTPPTIAPV